MKKINKGMRLVSMVMALVMALAAGVLSFPASARAATTYNVSNWSDLQSAMTQAQPDDYVSIIGDFTLEGDLTIPNTLTFGINAGCTLSTGSYSITSNSTDFIVFGTLSIDENGSVTNNDTIYIDRGVIINSGMITNTHKINNGGTITNNGMISNSGEIISTDPCTFTGNPVTGNVPPMITTASLSDAIVGSSYSQTLAATGDTPLTWQTSSNDLPDGLTRSGATISGTPTTAGTFDFNVTVSNSGGSYSTLFRISVLTPITTAAVSVTAPSTGAVSGTTATNTNSSYNAGPVSWSGNPAKFAGEVSYLASVTLTAASGYTFTGLSSATINGQSASISNNTGDSVTLSYAFAPVSKYAPTLMLITLPNGSQTYPGNITLTATLSGADTNAGQPVTFSVNGVPLSPAVVTGSSGMADLTLPAPNAGTYSFSATFAGDDYNNSASDSISSYTVDKGTQASLSITGVPSPLSYGDNDFTLSTSGGSGTGYVSFSVTAGNGVLSVDPTTGVATILGAGTVKVTATKASDGNYLETSASLDITVAPRDIALATVTLTGAPFTFTGSAIKPAYSVADGALAISSSDYTVSYDNNIDVGTATLILTGQGNYTGTKQVAFDIVNTPAMDEVISDINNLPGANSSNPVGDWNDADKVADAAKAYDKLSPEEKAQIPQSVKDALDAAKKQAGDANKVDVAHSASVAGNLPWNVRLVITPIASTDTSYTSFLAKLAGKNLLVLDNIKLIDTLTDQEYVLPSGQSVEVTLGGLSLSGTHIAIAHQTAAGLLESLDATVNGDSVSFATSTFSLYGVTSDKALIPVVKLGTKPKAVAPLAPLAPLATPDTGDNTALSDSLWTVVTLLLSAGIALVIRRKRYVA